MPDVFISYSADARKLAESIAHSLRQEGVSTWIDFENAAAGERISDQILQALDQARFYLLIVGPRNLMRDSQDREWQGALERTWSHPEKRIIPLLIGQAETPSFLKNWNPLRFQPGGELGLVKKLKEIFRSENGSVSPARTLPLGNDWRKRIRAVETTANRLKSLEEPPPVQDR